jgi:putative heme degradation protein
METLSLKQFRGLNDSLRHFLQMGAAKAKVANMEEAGEEAGHKLLAQMRQKEQQIQDSTSTRQHLRR